MLLVVQGQEIEAPSPGNLLYGANLMRQFLDEPGVGDPEQDSVAAALKELDEFLRACAERSTG